MAKAAVVINQVIGFKGDKFIVYLKVFKVEKSKKFPDGYKVRCILIDQHNNVPLLLLDNHEPFGYHIHTKLPSNHNFRVSTEVSTYAKAINLFLNQVKRLVNYEKK